MKEYKSDAKILQLLKQHEGLRLKPYYCSAGKLTIGYGRNLEDNGITKLEAELMLIHDIDNVQKELDELLPWWRDIQGEDRKRVLIDMGFNLGLQKLLGFENTLALIRAGHFEGAADNMLKSKWAKQVGQRARTLANMMRKG